MGRTKGDTNKESPRAPHTVRLTTDEKLEFLASLIVDKIIEDQKAGQRLLKNIGGLDVIGSVSA
jgi:hypothetical protein